jgi:hypothetical protein
MAAGQEGGEHFWGPRETSVKFKRGVLSPGTRRPWDELELTVQSFSDSPQVTSALPMGARNVVECSFISLIDISGEENRDHGRKDPSRWPRDTFYPQKSALASPTSDGRSVGIVRSRTQATEFVCLYVIVDFTTFQQAGYVKVEHELYSKDTRFVSRIEFSLFWYFQASFGIMF